MKTLITYYSMPQTGNTKRVAETIAAEMGCEAIPVAKADASSQFDLLGLGSGVYGMRPGKAIIEFIAKLPAGDGRPAFIFVTYGGMAGACVDSLKRALEAKGYRVLDAFSCLGLDMFLPFKLIGGINKGRPNDADLAAARLFAKSIMASAGKRP